MAIIVGINILYSQNKLSFIAERWQPLTLKMVNLLHDNKIHVFWLRLDEYDYSKQN